MNSMLSQVLDQNARARLNTLKISKPEKAQMVINHCGISRTVEYNKKQNSIFEGGANDNPNGTARTAWGEARRRLLGATSRIVESTNTEIDFQS